MPIWQIMLIEYLVIAVIIYVRPKDDSKDPFNLANLYFAAFWLPLIVWALIIIAKEDYEKTFY